MPNELIGVLLFAFRHANRQSVSFDVRFESRCFCQGRCNNLALSLAASGHAQTHPDTMNGTRSWSLVILSLASFQLRPVSLDQRTLERMRQFGRESAGQEN